MKNRLKVTLVLCMMLLLGVTICANAQGAALNITKTTVNIGDVVDLDVTGTEKIPVWTSYNANIAKVNAEGQVTAVRKGKTTIKARAGSEYLTCSVTVVDSSIKLNKTTATIYTGGTSTNTVQLREISFSAIQETGEYVLTRYPE